MTAVQNWVDSRLRPLGPVDALGLALEIASLVGFVAELIIWPPDVVDVKVLLIRVLTLLINLGGYVARRLARREPFDYALAVAERSSR